MLDFEINFMITGTKGEDKPHLFLCSEKIPRSINNWMFHKKKVNTLLKLLVITNLNCSNHKFTTKLDNIKSRSTYIVYAQIN
jgi:hypothetical protein